MSNNYFRFRHFTIYQDLCAMKVGTDGTLLGSWANVPDKSPVRVLDAGTGTGVIALMLAQRFSAASIIGIDVDRYASEQAAANASGSPFHDRIVVRQSALQDFHDGLFDAVVCNPPYYEDSLKCADDRRSVSRHTFLLTYDELVVNAYRLLASDGKFSVIIPVDCMRRMETAAAIAGFFLTRQCAVRTRKEKPVKRLMLEYMKVPPGDVCCDELVINDEKHKAMMAGFYM